MYANKWLGTLLFAVSTVSLVACGDKKSNSIMSYEPKAITIVAPADPGGGVDKTARSLSNVLSNTKLINETISVENVPGASSAKFLATYMAKDVGNDNKLFVSSPPLLINNLKKNGSPYGFRDVTPLAGLTEDYGVLAVRTDSPYKTLQELINVIKTNPAKIIVGGGSSPGSMDHLNALLPFHKSGIDIKQIKYLPFDGGGKGIVALLGGEVEVLSTDASGVIEMAKAGRIRVLAVASPERLTIEPLTNVPTLKESGVDAVFVIWRGVIGPKDMSPAAYAYWQTTLKALSTKPEWQSELQTQGWIGSYKNGEDFKAFLTQQEATINELLTTLNLAK